MTPDIWIISSLKLKLGELKILKAATQGWNMGWLKPLQWEWLSAFLAAAWTEDLELDEAWVMRGGMRRGDRSSSLTRGRNELKVRRGSTPKRRLFFSPCFCSFSLHSVPSPSSYALGKQSFGATPSQDTKQTGQVSWLAVLCRAFKVFGLFYTCGRNIQ